MIYDIYKNLERIGSIEALSYTENQIHNRVQYVFKLPGGGWAIFYDIIVKPWDSFERLSNFII